MPDQQLPPCGIGGTSVAGGPCSGTYSPNQAGQDSFSQVSGSSATSAILAAGAILALVVFVVVMVRKVAGFFGAKERVVDPAGVGTHAYNDAFWSARGREANASIPDADFAGGEVAGLGYDGDPVESDTEADQESDADNEADLSLDELREKPGADLTDEEFDRLEWANEADREKGGV